MNLRSKGIGGTDIGAIIGVNPWKSKMDVYLEKIGIVEGIEDNDAMWIGREMEPILQKRYEKESGHETTPPYNLPLQHKKYDWYLGSPDDLVYKGGKLEDDSPPTVTPLIGGVDYKTTGSRNGWGDPGTDQVPEWIHTQADWYMGLTGAEWWDIAVLFFAPRREFCIYRIPRNQELIDNLIAAGKDFWENNVVPQIPPPIDASEGSKNLLNYLYPREQDDLIQANEYLEILAQRIKDQEYIRDNAVKTLTLFQNQMKDAIGTHAGMVTSLGKVTWKKNKDSEIVDWKAVADVLSMELSDDDYKKLINKYTTIKPGSRVFRAWWAKSKED